MLEFAQQSVELLRALHEKIGLLHLDLRLENFVITEQGVGFVDFGSAVRVDEDFSQNTILRILIAEMLAASQIHKNMKRLQAQSRVTSSLFWNCYQKISIAIDLFYLAV